MNRCTIITLITWIYFICFIYFLFSIFKPCNLLNKLFDNKLISSIFSCRTSSDNSLYVSIYIYSKWFKILVSSSVNNVVLIGIVPESINTFTVRHRFSNSSNLVLISVNSSSKIVSFLFSYTCKILSHASLISSILALKSFFVGLSCEQIHNKASSIKSLNSFLWSFSKYTP